MDQPDCCIGPSWKAELDLDHAAGFEFLLGRCERCGAYSMNVFCVASSITGYEPVSAGDVERMKATASGPEQKALMRAWADTHL